MLIIKHIQIYVHNILKIAKHLNTQKYKFTKSYTPTHTNTHTHTHIHPHTHTHMNVHIFTF